MKKDAEVHADEDKKKKELVDTRIIAETMIYTTEKMIKEFGEKVSEDNKKALEEKMEALKKVKDGDD